ncbi:Na/Pi cotransporter family protein [Ignatzschineria cameli]|uniref:Sodium:phosphate symporter n=1 Tax=Ignatzschineria cameli TaxID=2182793 RepID=A0A2U2AU34_9GAMM|nr:Na/Pi symporter [Ignatzschineria cameli]PWD88222.1 sodium:phosphate symporter [Ignatzschineria cameli]PWD91251.1 sodium:phosphate symporter [Ignatzschineria cameli]PWD92892.1 sodium:phosphate symporter [Ignatzschineria cameli]PWD93913.1 sodium:phosphate symporter [Ignatzschineria cameli]
MVKKLLKNIGIIVITILLLYSFYLNGDWLELCAGLAFFLFGMQSMQDGLEQLAGGRLERILAKRTETPFKSLLFGISSTLILQSTTVVALLIIAFISTGLITLTAGIGIIIGANVGASGGIWLLALAGQNVSLGPFAYPMVVMGILASFAGKTAKAAGRVLIGVAFILLAIDLIKNGFSSFTEDFDILSYQLNGWMGIIILVLVGTALTIVLQSSHATIMLILTMLALAQIDAPQGYALTIGAIVGSALATGILGFLGGDRSGMRVAGSHVIYNAGTALVVLILLKPIITLLNLFAIKFALDPLIQIAAFYTLFNIIGLLLFWPLKGKLALLLEKIIPNIPEPKQIVDFSGDYSETEVEVQYTPPKYLLDNALSSTQTATQAVLQELTYLSKVSLEVICHILFLKTEVLSAKEVTPESIRQYDDFDPVDADLLYRKHIKNLYSELLTFISKIEYNENEQKYQSVLSTCQIIAFKLVSAVKNSHHLQKNLKYYLSRDPSIAQNFYIRLRQYIVDNLRTIYSLHFYGENEPSSKDSIKAIGEELGSPKSLLYPQLQEIPLIELIENSRKFESQFRSDVYSALKKGEIDGFTTSSILNDLNYSAQIVESLFNILKMISLQDQPFLEKVDDILTMEESEL